MQGNEMKISHAGKFIGVRDSRNRRMPGLYTRNGRFYGLLWAAGLGEKKTARRFPLNDPAGVPCTNLAQAKAAFDLLRGARQEESLPMAGRKPGFSSWAEQYLLRAATLAKKPGTVQNETQSLARWKSHLGSTTVDKISTPMISAFCEKRLKGARIGGKEFAPAHPRTVRLDCIMLRAALKAAADAGFIRDLPRFPKITVPPPPRRALITPPQFESLLAACLAKGKDGLPITRNGEQLRDFVRFLAFCGCREQEGLRVRWAHVDFKNRCLFIGAGENFEATGLSVGAGGNSKNSGSRIMDFNGQLESLLLELADRRAPDSSWLFPSPQRGEKDIPARSLRDSLRMVREHAKLPEVGFHDFRHLFCSFCVMAGIDFMTIAGWAGHKDGGILIGKVYGHLLDEHRQKMAARLTIGLAIVPDAATA